MAAHVKWTAEIEQRLGVEIDVYRSPRDYVFWYGPIRGGNEDLAQAEMDQLETHVGELHYSLEILQGDAGRLRDHTRLVADLGGMTPWAALIADGLECIEAVLVGPDAKAAEMLAAEPQLLAAARYRVLHTHDLDNFTPHVRELIARADSILAAMAFDSVFAGAA